MQYSYIDLDHKTSIIPRKVNGGLYTGEPAKGPWGNVPILPESSEFIDAFYKYAEPPAAMKYQAVSTLRPGNNEVTFPHHTFCTTLNFNSLCASD